LPEPVLNHEDGRRAGWTASLVELPASTWTDSQHHHNRSKLRIISERGGEMRAHDFTSKAGVVHSEIMLPEGAPERWRDQATLWNEVEAGEKRRDAQLAREMEFSIPRELSKADAIRLARDFVAEQFVSRGMVADVNVHWATAGDGEAQPHAHVMLTMRQIEKEQEGEGRFGPKARGWNSRKLYEGVRERWAALANERLAEQGHDARIDHRNYAEQGIPLEPQHKIGSAGARRAERGSARVWPGSGGRWRRRVRASGRTRRSRTGRGKLSGSGWGCDRDAGCGCDSVALTATVPVRLPIRQSTCPPCRQRPGVYGQGGRARSWVVCRTAKCSLGHHETRAISHGRRGVESRPEGYNPFSGGRLRRCLPHPVVLFTNRPLPTYQRS